MVLVVCGEVCGCCVVLVLAWCGVAVWSVCVFSLFFLSILFFLFLALSFFLLSFLLLSSLHFSPRRPTSRHLNVIWRTASAQQSVLSQLLPPPFSPSPPQKKRGNFLLQEYFRRVNYLEVQFYLNSGKSPSGEITDITVFFINSKKFKLQRVKSVIIFGIGEKWIGRF